MIIVVFFAIILLIFFLWIFSMLLRENDYDRERSDREQEEYIRRIRESKIDR